MGSKSSNFKNYIGNLSFWSKLTTKIGVVIKKSKTKFTVRWNLFVISFWFYIVALKSPLFELIINCSKWDFRFMTNNEVRRGKGWNIPSKMYEDSLGRLFQGTHIQKTKGKRPVWQNWAQSKSLPTTCSAGTLQSGFHGQAVQIAGSTETWLHW